MPLPRIAYRVSRVVYRESYSPLVFQHRKTDSLNGIFGGLAMSDRAEITPSFSNRPRDHIMEPLMQLIPTERLFVTSGVTAGTVGTTGICFFGYG